MCDGGDCLFYLKGKTMVCASSARKSSAVDWTTSACLLTIVTVLCCGGGDDDAADFNDEGDTVVKYLPGRVPL